MDDFGALEGRLVVPVVWQSLALRGGNVCRTTIGIYHGGGR